jgi:predicted GNAT family acetyltransferase
LVQSVSRGIVALEEERVVATIMMTPYGDDAATINMVIVDAAMRGRGLGRKMMEEALAKAGERTCCLVATREGLSLYEKLGFVTTGEIVQHQGEALPVSAPARVSWAESGDLACLGALDREAFGHDRSALMKLLRERAKFAVIRDEGDTQAFSAIRPFGRGLVIGPVVARNGTEAKALIDFCSPIIRASSSVSIPTFRRILLNGSPGAGSPTSAVGSRCDAPWPRTKKASSRITAHMPWSVRHSVEIGGRNACKFTDRTRSRTSGSPVFMLSEPRGDGR